MCEPMSLTALAMTTAGAAAKARGNQIAKGKIGAATAAERDRQGKLAEESGAEFNRSMRHASPAEQAKMLAKANANRFSSMRGAMNTDQMATFRTANGVADNVADASRVRIGDANNLAISNARNDARLKAYDDVQLNNNLANARFGENIARIGGFAKGSAGVLGSEVDAATRPNGWADMGDLLTAGGSIAAGKAGAKPLTPA
jgi:hypothetical protein